MNIICVVFDSLRKDCVGYYGKPFWGKVNTPFIDSFAEEALAFTDAYPESLPTLPARRALYTGKRVYPFHNGDFKLKGDFVGAAGWGPIPEEDDTLSEIFSANGYVTSLISSVYPQFKPSKNYWRGFNQWNFIRGKENDPFKSGPEPTEDEINHYLPEEIHLPDHICPDGTLLRNFVKSVIKNIRNLKNEEDYPVAQVMLEAVKWLQENKDSKNFFLMLESFDPHESWNIPDFYRKMYDNSTTREQILSIYGDTGVMPEELLKRTQANYSGLVTMCDRWFGYLWESVKKMGLLDDTVIIVTSDHGHSLGDKDYMGKRTYPSTREVFEIPLLIRHPKGKGAGEKTGVKVQHHDIFSTMLSFAGIDYNGLSGKNIDGANFWSQALEKNEDFRKHLTIGWDSAVTVIDEKYWFNSRINGKGAFLYDRKSDPEFLKNLASGNKELVDRMFSLATEDAKNLFPAYLLRKAEKMEDFPGCSPIAAKVSGI